MDTRLDLAASKVFCKARLAVVAADDSVFTAAAGQLPALRRGLAPVNFVCGEVFFLDFCRVLRLLPLQASREGEGEARLFVDLGCGVGTPLAAAALFTTEAGDSVFSDVRGYDLMHSKLVECRLVVEALRTVQGLPSMEVVGADFLKQDWSSAHVVYACATCFDADTMRELEERKFPLLRPGACVVLIDKELSPHSPLAQGLLASCQVNTTWGVACARVYQLANL